VKTYNEERLRKRPTIGSTQADMFERSLSNTRQAIPFDDLDPGRTLLT